MKPKAEDTKNDVRADISEEQRMLEQSSLEELADYYDRTDTGDFPWEEAEDTVIERPELVQISLRLPKEDIAQIKRRANKAGVGYTTLIRMILREHLENPLTR